VDEAKENGAFGNQGNGVFFFFSVPSEKKKKYNVQMESIGGIGSIPKVKSQEVGESERKRISLFLRTFLNRARMI